MIDKILETALRGMKHGKSDYKYHALAASQDLLKKYWKILVALVAVALLLFIAMIWLLWGVLSTAVQGTNLDPASIVNQAEKMGASGVLEQVQQVGINGLMETPMKFVSDLWYGKDGK